MSSVEDHELQVHSSSWESDSFFTLKVTFHVLGLCCKHERGDLLTRCVSPSNVKTRVLHKLEEAEVVGVHGRQIP